MADELQKYLANRLKYHTASRIATQTGESLAQALNVDGHTVTMSKVWAAKANAFAYNANKANTDSFDATTDLVAVFKAPFNGSSVTSGEIADGKWWENTAYPAVRLYEGVKMTTVKGSDGGGKFQAFEVLADADGKSSGTPGTPQLRLTDWIAPTAVADPTNRSSCRRLLRHPDVQRHCAEEVEHQQMGRIDWLIRVRVHRWPSDLRPWLYASGCL